MLGPLVARCDGRQVDLGTTRRAALLARLAVSRHSVSPVRLAEDVWGSADATALGAVRVTIKRLRDLLGAAAIVHDQHGYRVERTVLAVDADRFGSLVDAARDGALAMRLGRLDEALALWSGPAYAGLVEYDAVAGEATRLDELREYAIDERFDLRVRLGAGPELVAELEQAVAAAPQRERRCASLVTALYRSGRQSDALVALRRLEARLRDELGLSLSPELNDLQRKVLNHEPSLSTALPIGGRAAAHGDVDANRSAAVALARLGAGDAARRLMATAVAGARALDDEALLCSCLVDSARVAAMAAEHDTTGDPGFADAMLVEAEMIARRRRDGALLSRVALARFGGGFGDGHERLLVQLAEPLDRLARRGPERLELLSASAVLATFSDDVGLARRLLAETAAIAGEMDDRRGRALHRVVSCILGMRTSASIGELETWSLRALDDALACDDSALIAAAMHARLVALCRAGDVDEIARLAVALGALGHEALLPFAVQRQWLLENTIALVEGRLDGLLQRIDEGAAAGRRMGTAANGTFVAQRLMTMRELGQHAVVLPLLRVALDAGDTRPQIAEVGALLMRHESGDPPTAAEIDELVVRLADPMGGEHSEVVVAFAAELSWWARSPALAAGVLPLLAADPEANVVLGLGTLLLGPTGLYRALCDATQGRLDDAIGLLDALDQSHGHRAATIRQRIRWYLIAVLRRRGTAADLRRADELAARSPTSTPWCRLLAERVDASEQRRAPAGA